MSQIEGSAVLDIRDLVSATLKTETDIPSVVVPDGFEVKSLESLQLAPSRIRQSANLISPGSLIAYIQRFRDERTVVLRIKPKHALSPCWISTRTQTIRAGLHTKLFMTARSPTNGNHGLPTMAAKWTRSTSLNSWKTIFRMLRRLVIHTRARPVLNYSKWFWHSRRLANLSLSLLNAFLMVPASSSSAMKIRFW